MTLDALGLKYGTDKASAGHGYLERYERYFQPLCMDYLRFLEIGVAGGHSIRLWQDYFPFTEIFAVDHNPASIEGFKGISPQDDRRTQLVHGDASEAAFWQRFGQLWCKDDHLDIMIDDASHNVWATMQALNFGWPLLAPGGLWCIEDTHAGFDAAYRRDNCGKMPAHFTTTDMLNDLANTQLHEHGAGQTGKPSFGEWDFMHCYKSLVIIGKRK